MGGACSRLWFVVAMITALGCGTEDPGPNETAWVTIGAGDEQYAGLADDDSVQIVLGPQGGYMIALALQAGCVVPGDDSDPADPDNPRMTFRALRVDNDDVLGIITQQRGLSPVEDETYESFGTWLIFNPSIDTADYFDAAIRVEVDLVDTHGSAPSDFVTVSTIAPPVTESLDLDVEPGEVIGRSRDDAEHATGDVGDAQEQEVTGLGLDRHVAAEEAAFERHVAHVPRGGVVE
jgi:hypothetical protein